MKKDKQAYRKYKKMCKKHLTDIKKIAKNCCPFEAFDGLSLMVEQIRWMYDYYKLGYNVWGMESCESDPEKFKDEPTRFEMCKQILKEYEAWQNCKDKYFIHHDTGGRENGKGMEFKVIKSLKDPKIIETETADWWIETPGYDLFTDACTACKKEEDEHRHKFFELYEKYYDALWD